jgi:hypothetical protein
VPQLAPQPERLSELFKETGTTTPPMRSKMSIDKIRPEPERQLAWW